MSGACATGSGIRKGRWPVVKLGTVIDLETEKARRMARLRCERLSPLASLDTTAKTLTVKCSPHQWKRLLSSGQLGELIRLAEQAL